MHTKRQISLLHSLPPWRAWHTMHGRDGICVHLQYADILAPEVMPVSRQIPHGRAFEEWLGPKSSARTNGIPVIEEATKSLYLPAS